MVMSNKADLSMYRQREGERGVEFEPCILSGYLHGAAVFGAESNYKHPPATVFLIPHSMQLLGALPRLYFQPKCHCFVYVREIKQKVKEGLQPYCERTSTGASRTTVGTYTYIQKGSTRRVYIHFYYKLCLISGNVSIHPCTCRPT